MSDLETLKLENANLKSQLSANQQGVSAIMAQLEAHKGELADARVISLQLRTNLCIFQKSHNELSEKVKLLESQLAAKQEAKSAEVLLKGK